MPSNSIRRLVIFANEFSLYIKVDDRILINYLYQFIVGSNILFGYINRGQEAMVSCILINSNF
jgi:Na+-translocating ferredoxin:NAD+ oxidoreductase RnfC subunit